MSEALSGRFVWHDLMTSDIDAAVDFYGKLIGWGTQDFEGSKEPYTMWTNGGVPLGGLMVLPEEARTMGAPNHWLAYVLTADVDATVAQITELGGAVLVPPTDIPNTGRFAVFADPQGAVMALFSPAGEAPGHDGESQRGEFSWHELITTDYEAALTFYSALFGWEKAEAVDMGEIGMYQMFGRAGSPVGGMFNKPPEMPQPPAWLHYIKVGSVDEAVEKVTAMGGQVVVGPMDVPGGDRVANCIDPQGAAFALHSAAS